MHNIGCILRKIERTPIGLVAGTITFLAIIFIRNQLELLLEADHNITISLSTATVLADHVHVIMAWSYIYLMSVIVLATAGGCRWAGATRVSLCGFTLIWVPPLLDGAFGLSGAIIYQYRFDSFLSSFSSLFLPWVEVGYVTPGVRVEVFLVMLATLAYVGLCSVRRYAWWRAVLSAFLVYCAIFSMGYLPALVRLLSGNSHFELLQQSVLGVTATTAPVLWYLPVLLPLAIVFMKNTQPRLWKVFTSCLRTERMLIYLLFALAGVLQGADRALIGSDWLNLYDITFVALALLCVAMAFIAMTALNDICDANIDALSNPSRPLTGDKTLLSEYWFVLAFGVLLSIGMSFTFGVSQPVLLVGMLSLGGLYSLPPLRLRSYLLLAPLTLTLIALVCYQFGMALIWNNSTPEQLNLPQLGGLALLFFIAVQFKDIKDEAGDRAHGVQTIATCLGARRAYWVLGTLLLVAFAGLIVTGELKWSAANVLAGLVFVLAFVIFKKSEWVICSLVGCLALLLLN
ncbi:UbiA family prenyltransferase [Alteromonas gilva]|uniref:UbiA family prenyltransferase n=1 Tax=Alteromonas gilva TaxID=2987522 RepID=A0ABT5L1P5_9ALTE|nr:UbiA family prenyltransferase [Alteromonas gilva]MDC8830803.1 UbiA family prenyltransferase [Alteromonas gilva]